MKTLTWHVFVCAAMVLGACGLARADERDNGCTLRTLRGTYVFSATGFNIVAGVAQPKAIVEVIHSTATARCRSPQRRSAQMA